MAEARVPRPKGIPKPEWDEWIDKLAAYRALDPADPNNEVILLEKAEEIADQTTAMFLMPVVL